MSLLVALLAASALADEPAPVTLTYGWRPGWRGTTEVVLTRTVDGVPWRTVENHARVTVRRDGDGLLVQDALSFDAALGLPQDGPFVPPDHVRQAVVHRIGPDGRHRGFAPADALARLSYEALDAMLQSLSELGPPARHAAEPLLPVVREALGADALAAAQTDAWDDAVGSWAIGHRAGFVEGAAVGGDVLEEDERGATALRQRRTWTLRETRPCHDGRRAPACVVLERRIEDAPADAADAPADGPAATRVQTLRVVVEPDTLRPWSLHRETTTTGARPGPDGALVPVRWVDTKDQAWTWTR